MKTVDEVMAQLQKKSSEQTRKTLCRHFPEVPMFGVKVADLKVIAKQIKGKQELAEALFETGNYDAMYLAGLVADGRKMTRRTIEHWARNPGCSMTSEYPVAWIATESRFARSLATKWIGSRREDLASSGWCTWSGIVATWPDEDLDLDELQGLLDRVVETMDSAANRVRYTMNGFVISVGGYVKPLLKQARAAARTIGKVEVDMGDTACKVPLATDYIKKMEQAGRIGRKRKTIRC